MIFQHLPKSSVVVHHRFFPFGASRLTQQKGATIRSIAARFIAFFSVRDCWTLMFCEDLDLCFKAVTAVPLAQLLFSREGELCLSL